MRKMVPQEYIATDSRRRTYDHTQHNYDHTQDDTNPQTADNCTNLEMSYTDHLILTPKINGKKVSILLAKILTLLCNTYNFHKKQSAHGIMGVMLYNILGILNPS